MKMNKTNAMRILEKNKIPYTPNFYECTEFIDAVTVADMLHQDKKITFKTLITEGKPHNYYCFVIQIEKELDLKAAAAAVGEKSLEMIHVKDLKDITGYIRGGCTPIGLKKPYPVTIDDSINDFEKIIISGGMIGAQIFMAPKDLIKITKAKTANITKEQK